MNAQETNGASVLNGLWEEGVGVALLCCDFTPRRLRDDGETDVMTRETLELLERMRVDLNQMKSSVDLREQTERTMSVRAARHLMVSLKKTDPNSQDINDVSNLRLPRGNFYFVPMATAPLTSLSLYGSSVDSSEGGVAKQRQQLVEHLPKKQVNATDRLFENPPWNASTSFQRLEKKSAAKGVQRKVSPDTESARKQLGGPLRVPVVLPTREKTTTSPMLNWDPPESDIFQGEVIEDKFKTTDNLFLSDEFQIRDYLRRLNIVGCEVKEFQERIDDDVLNGVALRRLVGLVLNAKGNKENYTNTILPLKAKNIEDVRQNYLVALNAIGNAEKMFSLSIPRECRLIRPESVIVRGESSSLFLLLRTIIHSCLPTNYVHLWNSPSLTWQPNLYVDSYAPETMRTLELAVCSFLYSQDVLADPVAHQLPSDDSIVPSALNAPFLPPHKKQWCLRRDEFPSLFIPSVFPFLTNGTVLCDVVERITGNRLTVHRNPRVKSNCIENIQTAFTELQKYSPSRMSSLFIDNPHHVFYGDRRYILLLLEDIMRLKNGASPRRRAPCSIDVPYLGPKHLSHVSRPAISDLAEGKLPVTAFDQQIKPSGAFFTSCSNKDANDNSGGSNNGSGRDSGDGGGICSKTPERTALRCVIASPLSSGGIVKQSVRPERNFFSPSALPCEANPETCISGFPFTTFNGSVYTESDIEAIRKWFIAVLGSEFHYTAADTSFSVSCKNFQIHERCLIFSDGVILAHLIRTLERRRCTELESVEMHAKAPAAKRRNIRKCVSFLQREKRVLLDVPLLDEILLSGDSRGVLYVINCLKYTYRFAVKV
ncbi:hypothetical protein LSM04_004876 [Trypanosoma melophagium]|uniref:uncharacterized protein n=1 Tax=Trypanosoma melophagium TaxID=715481 RepID=UPI00351A4848|nr:hypothetical protein LSM04_004876 [Trypanosoma melophagium]